MDSKKNKKRYDGWNLKDFKNYYNENYSGKGAREVSKLDHTFYTKVRENGYTKVIFPKIKRGRKSKFEKYSELELKQYYNKNLLGKSKTEVNKEDNNFYRELIKRNNVKKIIPPKKRKEKNNRWKDYEEEDFKIYYQENFAGLEETLEDYRKFRQEVRLRGLLKKIIPE